MPPGHPPPVFSAAVKADSGKASPSPVLGRVLGGVPQSPHSLLCPRAPCAWLWPTPCLAELPWALPAVCWHAGLGALERKGAGSRQECAGLVCITRQRGNRLYITAEGAQSRAALWEGAGLGLWPGGGSSRQAACSSRQRPNTQTSEKHLMPGSSAVWQ